MNRRIHSSIDELPRELRETIIRMIVDNIWPPDTTKPDDYDGNPRYIDCVAYCNQKGHEVSLSAMGRFGIQMRTHAMMKNAGIIACETMADLTDEDSPKTIKAAAKMMTALSLQFMVEHQSLSSKQLKEVSQAIRDCATVAIKAQQHLNDTVKEKVETAAASTKKKLGKAGVDRKLIQEIIDEHLGVVKS
jgi:hypothetical protein